MLDLKKLEKKVDVNWTEEGKIQSVTFEFSNDELAHMMVRSGQYYLGGCCGQMSGLQDQLNHRLRMGAGVLSARDLEVYEDCARGHDGFEFLEQEWTQEMLDEKAKRWRKLDPHEKIVTVICATRDRWESNRVLSEDRHRSEEEIPVRLYGLHRSSEYLCHASLFRDQEGHPPTTQRLANEVLALVKSVPGAKMVLEAAEERTPMEGWVLVLKGDRTPVTNLLGLAFYETEEAAKEGAKGFDEANGPDLECEIARGRISIENGLEVLDA